ncbi:MULTISPECIES: TIGR03618 family F420-dependent PPOX class oxidoreductase [unclassified Nocardia]|uniref:TIGR03618 family F420-dependent PPOX class oxidoreductase n=1 Tax=unclassified Nocardia TaxID=2637762 RepID=UPI0024A9120E|nr:MULTISPECIES: TIGR03618 family F420-dependent PPOX class oxidoreductase [unclassified Nocardia]
MSLHEERALPEAVRNLFTGTNYAHIATLLPDGSPHTVPIWVDVEGDTIVFLTGPDARKARNLERDDRVAISVTDHQRPFVMATVRGRVARRLTGDSAWVVIDRMSHKYLGVPYPREEERVVYAIDPVHVWTKDFAGD